MPDLNKVNKDIKINQKQVGKIVLRYDDQSISWVKRLVLSNLRKLNKFYKTDYPEINLELVYSRKEFDDKIGRHTPDWMVGVSLKNKIYLFSPLSIEKFSTHKKSKLNKIIAHELCHIFNNKINKEILNWVDEGTALFLADQKKAKDFKKSDWYFFIDNFLNENINLRSFAKHEGYKISYWLVRTIIENLGVNTLYRLIKINPKKGNVRSELEKVLRIPAEDFLKINCPL